jgi:hypothetical protein
VVPTRPLKLTDIVNKWVSVSKSNIAFPVAGDWFGGDSEGPFKEAEY